MVTTPKTSRARKRKTPPLREICRRITVEFPPKEAELIETKLEAMRADDPTASYSSLLRTLVRQHLS